MCEHDFCYRCWYDCRSCCRRNSCYRGWYVIAVHATEGPTIGLSERLTAGATEGVIGNFGEGEKDGEAPDKMAALGRKMPEAAEYSVVTENMYELVLRKTEM